MAIKKTASKKTSKKTAPVQRESSLEYRFVKSAGEAEPNPETTFGVVYRAIKKIKSGKLDDVVSAATSLGISKYSNQDHRQMCRLALRQFANEGYVKQTRNGEEVNGTSAKSAKGAKKSFKLVNRNKK